ncbi:tRNA-dependent cyclodipeptide synthase [Streptomyces gobiensis]|uniref:tRNA-dependent cyclodipeptide synthase n=1 Tax=Streptomyces gobiensis TaxID=2875706 RepID=UPI001E5A9B40|nr:tRNA-dependent cyclodipeptide synthase [Streptomyces gobiensis]UGY91087.1 tRNA-dependent cyclodipeptide synthase [Streptomyces gobiensis]
MSECPTFDVLPLTDRCRLICKQGDHALIGVSPGNSYFTPQRIAELVSWADRTFEAVDIVYADLYVDAMFEALGYSPEHARKRSTKDLKAVRRRIQRGVESAGPLTGFVRVHALSEFADNGVYRELQHSVGRAMESDTEFLAACTAMVRQFVGYRLAEDEEPTPAQLHAGMSYIAAELPFFVDTPGILGMPSSVSCYHARVPLTGPLFERETGLRAVDNQAYAVVTPKARPQHLREDIAA